MTDQHNAYARSYAKDLAWWRIKAAFPSSMKASRAPRAEEEWLVYRDSPVHVDRFRPKSARGGIVLFHGVGTHGRLMSALVGADLADAGFEVWAPDMPGYGLSRMSGRSGTYADWVGVGRTLVEAARSKHAFVGAFGVSAGGMLAYHVAGQAPLDALAATSFLDQRLPEVRLASCRGSLVAVLGAPVARLATRLGLGNIRIRLSLVSKMWAVTNSQALRRAMFKDPSSAANSVSLRFLADYLNYVPAIDPAEFDQTPVMLVQPADDRWTPQEASEAFLRRLPQRLVTRSVLRKCGHVPVEEPGLSDLRREVVAFFADNASEKMRLMLADAEQGA